MVNGIERLVADLCLAQFGVLPVLLTGVLPVRRKD
jgi:hypothetical protein